MDEQDEAMAGEYLAQRASARKHQNNVVPMQSNSEPGTASTVLIDKEESSLLELGARQQKLGAGKNPAVKTSGLKKPSRVG